MRRRFGRRRTFDGSTALMIGAVAVLLALIARRRVANEQRGRRAKQAAKEAADTIRESQERRMRDARGFSERVTGNLRAGTESTRAASQAPGEQAQNGRPEESGEVLDQGTGEAERSPSEDIKDIEGELVGRSRSGPSREAPEAGSREELQAGTTASGVREGAEGLPIEGYDSLNVKQVTQKLKELNVEEIERLRDYEARNKNRRTLMERLDRRVKAGSSS